MNKAEYREAREQFEKDFALRAFHIRRQIEQEDAKFVFLGTDAARHNFTEQLKASHEAKIAELLEVNRQELELIYFGTDGLREEETTVQTEATVVPIAPAPVETSRWQRFRFAWLAAFW